MIGRLERGLTAPSFETITALAEALQVAPVELFGGEPSAISGERREVLHRRTKLLASSSDAELSRAERILNALLRDWSRSEVAEAMEIVAKLATVVEVG
jgi:transcriptional regulator with XRE-family HTH domain